MRAWVAGLNGSPYWTTFSQYVTALGFNPPFIELKGECVDPENEGTFFDCPDGNSAQIVPFDNTNGNGCNLPVDNAIYLVMPSYSDVTLGGAGGCHGFNNNVGGTGYSTAIALGSTAVPSAVECQYGYIGVGGGQPTLNLSGFPGVDCSILLFGHELAESVTHFSGGSASGWFCGGSGSAEIADQCEGTSGTVTGYTYTAAGGSGASAASWGVNLDGTHYDFAAPPLVQLKPFSLCADNGIPASSIGISCATQPDCLVTVGMGGNQWQNNCVAGHCVVPTCTDGVADGDESDVDCGGSCSNDLDSIAVGLWCASGKKCRSGADCQSAICTASVCN